MSNIASRFCGKKNFVAFLTAGDPTLEATARYIRVMADAGADLIEIGVPFSDPIAEGPVIQNANIRAMKNGVTLEKIFALTRAASLETDVPLALLTYLNPVFKYGYDRFFSDCADNGVQAVILPDCPVEERGPFAGLAEKNGVDVITLIAPTSGGRIASLAEKATGFIYLVSSMGVTGARKRITTDIVPIVEKIRAVTDLPICVGFGVSTPEQANAVAAVSDGAIVGSAIVEIIERYKDRADRPLARYVESMKRAVQAFDGYDI